MQKNNTLKIILSVTIVSIILFANISSVAAANNQGLEWGIGVGDRFDYDFDVSYQNSTLDLVLTGEMYVIVNSLGDISDDVTSLPNIPIGSLYIDSFTTYWSNGTVMDDFWKSISFMGSPFLTYPIGNWTLMTELFEAVMGTVVVTQDATILNYTIVDVPTAGNLVTQVFQKSNGVPSYQLYDILWGEATVDIEFTLTSSTTASTTTATTTTTSGTTGTTTGTGDSTLILILGGGAAVAVVIIVIVIMRRK